MAEPFDPTKQNSPILLFKTRNPPSKTVVIPSKKTESYKKPVYVMWDLDKGPLPEKYGILKFRDKIEAALLKCDKDLELISITCVGNFKSLAFNENERIATDRHRELTQMGVNLFVTPPTPKDCQGVCNYHTGSSSSSDMSFNRVVEVGDSVLAREMKHIHGDFPVGVMALVSENNNDFRKSLQFLVERGWEVIIIEPEGTTSMRDYSRAVYK